MALISDDNVYDAWLSSSCMPSIMLRNVFEIYKWSSSSVYEAFRKNDSRIQEIISPRFMLLLKKNDTPHMLDYWREKMEKYSIRTLRYKGNHYPDRLTNIDNPPTVLFYRGNPECLSKRTIAMVGSRAASYSGQKASRQIAAELSRHSVSVISGLACGIDTCAHRGCIDGGSPTVAVAGNGLDRVYPSDNKALSDEIIEKGGLLLSEYAPGEKPAGWHFPVRNRIIAGLSCALVLMEAKIRSGSMTTVRHALEQGKDVFVYPGDPLSEYFEGNHQLLREGGIYFTSAYDILEDLHWLDNTPAVRQNIDCSADRTRLSPEEECIVQALQPGCISFEQLRIKTKLDAPVLMRTITILQIRGLIEALPGKIYQLVR